MLTLTKKKYTASDYDLLPEDAPYQLIGGELIMTPSPMPFHQEISGNIFVVLHPFVRAAGLGKLYNAPLDVYFTSKNVFQPDLLFFRTERLGSIRPNEKIRIAPDLVVEILSPSTSADDYARKKSVYREQGVKEYWIIDPEEKTIEILINSGAEFQQLKIFRMPSTLESPMFPGFRMELEDIFRF